MAGRRIKPSHIGSVAVHANEITILVDSGEFLADILPQPFLVMTFGTRRDGHVGSQPSKRSGLRDVDMAGSAFCRMVFSFTAALMFELQRNPFRRIVRHVGGNKFVTAGAVIVNWLLRLPVAIETGFMTQRHGLETRGLRHETVYPTTARSSWHLVA